MKNIILITLLVVLCLGCKSENEVFTIPSSLEIVDVVEESKEVCLECEHKIVVYCDYSLRSLSFLKVSMQSWSEISDEYPDVGFLFVFHGKNKSTLERTLKEYEFPFQVMFDQDNEFYNLNNLEKSSTKNKPLQAFHLDGLKNVKIAQIGIPNLLRKEIEEFRNN
ncbi:hypothetical protein Belba_0439 [Belliella baltica DSM 15883]|uniref:Uncharacterized protein n=1 Tax=Belliella baltica (strain DSM 15883 / CIP 108006 / LMG 21964 / BA134) TaxID=866536 RepID=I3Z1I0_BELBD|nr:hypothetical protein [Belliella baltica]AFL83098.1 hypothetical protein Belba_0439 [Belliella baltica DSM 15883]